MPPQMTQTIRHEGLAYPDGFTLTLERRFRHSRERVFNAWTQVDAIRRWMGPEGMTCDGAEADVRVGGEYRFPMTNKDGGISEVFGTYTEIDPPKRLAFTWAWLVCEGEPGGYQMLVTLDFHEDGDGTRMILNQTGLATEEARDRHEEGWCSSFNCLDTLLSQS